jgi:tRNA-dihydrouridine synthase B
MICAIISCFRWFLIEPLRETSIEKESVIQEKTHNVGLKLGTLKLDVPFFQASLSGYSDYAMRRLARRYGCPFAMADMILAKSAANPQVLCKPCFLLGDNDHPVGAQILGRTPTTMAKAARDLVAVGYDLIDLNFACPAPKILRRGRGGALLDDPDTVIKILKAVRSEVTCPVLMKLRIGLDHKPLSVDNFWEIVNRAIEHGVDALVIHGRTVSEKYRDKADWDFLAKVKAQFPAATIIGSGDIYDPLTTVDLLKRTGLDGFVVARGAVGNPWIFHDLRCVWENRPLPPAPDLAEQQQVMLEHLDMVMQGYPEKRAVGYFRKFLPSYARRHPQRKKMLPSLMKIKTRAGLEAAIEIWYKNVDTPAEVCGRTQ